jgi:hypothetical protein
MGKLNGLELKRARLVPSAMFASPDAVLQFDGLSRAQKIQILRRWEFDVRRTLDGDASTPMREVTGILAQVQGALAALGAPPPVAALAAEPLATEGRAIPLGPAGG